MHGHIVVSSNKDIFLFQGVILSRIPVTFNLVVDATSSFNKL